MAISWNDAKKFAKSTAKIASPALAVVDFAKDVIDPRTDVSSRIDLPFNNGSQSQPSNTISQNDLNKYGFSNYNDAKPAATENTGPYTTGVGGAGGADAAERAAILLQIEQGLTGANDALGRLDNQWNTGKANIGREFQDAYGRLINQKKLAEADYNQNKIGQLNEYMAARNDNNTSARSWMESARRTLGSQGAGGGSAARYAVPYEAQQMATQANSQDQQVNNRNIMSIEQAWDRNEDEFANSEADLRRQREQGERDFRSDIESQRAELLNTIGTLTGQRTIAQGGDYNAALAASQPYTSKIKSILDRIDGLAATPKIQERRVTLDRPDLSGYNWARPEQPVVAPQDPTLSQGNPLLALFGLQDERQLI